MSKISKMMRTIPEKKTITMVATSTLEGINGRGRFIVFCYRIKHNTTPVRLSFSLMRECRLHGSCVMFGLIAKYDKPPTSMHPPNVRRVNRQEIWYFKETRVWVGKCLCKEGHYIYQIYQNAVNPIL